MRLSERALLVRLSITEWSGRKLDKQITADVAQQHQAANDAGNYRKKILSSPLLDRVGVLTHNAKLVHYKYTLPWADTKQRIITSAAFVDYSRDVRQAHTEWDEAVNKFVNAYPKLIEASKVRLNSMFREQDYPSRDEVRARFTWITTVDGIPDAEDFRVDLGARLVNSIRADYEARTQQQLRDAQQTAWERVKEALEHLLDRLQNATNWREANLANLREVCDLLPVLNVADDPNLDKIARGIKQRIGGMDSEAIRASDEYRQECSQEVAKTLKSLGGMWGAK